MDGFGETFRILRKERDFTLKAMSQGIISFSYLSKFEKGESDITLTKFIQLIKRLNMTLDEFLFFNKLRTTNYGKLFQLISLAYMENNKTDLKRYLKKEKELYNKNGIIYHKCNSIMIAAIIQDIDNTFLIPQNEINFLVDYIVKCSFWTTYEVSLLGNTLALFSEDLLLILLSEVKKRLEEYKVSSKNIRDLIALIENACIVLIRNNKIRDAKALSSFLDTYLEPSYFFEKARKIFIDGIILLNEGKRDEGIKKSVDAIQIMNMLSPSFADNHAAELNYFLKDKPKI